MSYDNIYKEKQIDLALKLTEIKFKNYTCQNYADYSNTSVYDYFKDTLKSIEKDWRDNIE